LKSNKQVLGSEQRPIRVGVSTDRPFAYFRHGQLAGLAGALFLNIAKFYSWHYTLIPLDENIEAGIQKLKEGRIDLLIGPVSVYHHRILEVDYTRPYFINEIGIALQKVGISPFRIFYQIIEQIGFSSLLVFIIITLTLSTLLWYFEHHEKGSKIPASFFKGVLTTVWLFLVQFLQGGYELSHRRLASRITFMAWLFFSFLLLTLFISSATAFLTTDLINSHPSIINKSDLQGHALGYVRGRGAVNYIKRLHAKPVAYDTLAKALEALNQKESPITGVIEDYMILLDRYQKMRLPLVMLSSITLGSDEFAFALPYGSPLRAMINKRLVQLQDNEDMYYLCQRYLKDKVKNCQL